MGDMLTQEEINALLAGAGGDSDAAADDAAPAAAAPAADSGGGGGMLSQEEINALLAGGGGDAAPAAAPPPAADSGGGGGMLSQEEINALLAGGGGDAAPAPAPAAAPAGGDSGGGMLSQEEINALLAGGGGDAAPAASAPAKNYDDVMSAQEKDCLGEVGNISMGTSATTLFTLLNGPKVLIDTPSVSIVDWRTMAEGYSRPCVGIRVSYKEGIEGSNILILREHDVKIIADLMMGGEGTVQEDANPLSELELSAISEAMNQMVGSSSTSLSSIINRKIDIDTPHAMMLNFGDDDFFDQTGFAPDDILACVSFRMEIGDLIDSSITQIIPIEFAKDIVTTMMAGLGGGDEPAPAAPPPAAAPPAAAAPQAAPPAAPPPQAAPAAYPPPQAPAAAAPQYAPQPQYAPPPPGYYAPQPGMDPAAAQQPAYYAPPPDPRQPVMYAPFGGGGAAVNAQPAQFQTLDITELTQQKENIGIIMDVPLDVTVELGRTSRKIREILEFAPGTIVDLDKIAGEPIDILVNGKFVATGEVVVVDENFAVRVVDIVNVEKRI